MAVHETAREFFVGPVAASTFFRESSNEYAPWTPVGPDYHLPRPESHNIPRIASNITGFPAHPAPEHLSHIYGGSSTQPLFVTQGNPPLQPAFEHSQPNNKSRPSVHDHPPMMTINPTFQDPTRVSRITRRSRRLTRAYDPIRNRTSGPPYEGKRGRTRGVPNYKPRELQVLIDIVDEELPIASKGWEVASALFREWAASAEQPARTGCSLELKFKQLVKTKKPTGDVHCPPEVRRAHEIKLKLKPTCRDLEDEEIFDIEDNSDLEDDAMSDVDGNRTTRNPATRVRAARIEAPLGSQESLRQPSSKVIDALEKILKSFDPEVQSRRYADRTFSLLQTQQLILLQSQIRDLNATILSLRSQLGDSERRRTDADRRANRLRNQMAISALQTRLFRSAR